MIIAEGTIVYDELKEEFTVEKYIGSGSFGDVYLLSAKKDGREFALKTIKNPFDEKDHKTFRNEGNLALEIEHANVIKYYYFHDGEHFPELPPYIIMEYAEGGTLLDIIYNTREQQDFYSNEELKVYFGQLISGMEEINAKLVHRDIKPDNILFKEGMLKITDFGLAKVVAEGTRTSSFKGYGCIQYLAPEGWNFDKNTIKMDIYSMGIVFYELACFRHPLSVTSSNMRDWENAHLYQAVEPISKTNPGISSVLDKMISKMTAKNQSERPNDWAEVREYLERDNLPVAADKDLIEATLKTRHARVQEEEQEQLKIEEEQQKESRYLDIIKYQFDHQIVTPLGEFINDLNTQAGEGILGIKQSNEDLTVRMRGKLGLRQPKENLWVRIECGRGNSVEIMVAPIHERDFIKQIPVDDYGRRTTVSRTEIPEYNHSKIMAWGYVKGSDGRGLNLLLVENDENDYGTWYTLQNRNRVGVVRERSPEPFPFELEELEQEIKTIRITHIYVTEDRVLDLSLIKELLSSYV